MRDTLEKRVEEIKKSLDQAAAQYNFWVGRLEEATYILQSNHALNSLPKIENLGESKDLFLMS